MGLKFSVSGSQGLIQPAPLVTAPPFTVGMWVMYRNVNGAAFSMCDPAANTGWEVCISSSTLVRLGWFDAGAVAANGTANATIALTEWFFVVARFIANNNRRLSVMRSSTFAVEHDFSTVNLSVAATRMSLGCFSAAADAKFSNSAIGEFWITDADIGDPATPLADDLVRQLALYGPFSVPHVAPTVVDHLALRSDALMQPGEVYHRGSSRPWTILNAPVTCEHPPIHGHYQRPGQVRRLMVV